MSVEIAVIEGDGIGKEVVPAAVEVLDAIAETGSIGAFEYTYADAGDAVAKETGEALPAETYEAAANADATLFGAAGETAADVILPLRDAVGSFVNVRPARAYPGVDAVRPETDVVFLRENTEGGLLGSRGSVERRPLDADTCRDLLCLARTRRVRLRIRRGRPRTRRQRGVHRRT